MAVRPMDQIGMDETLVYDHEIEELLEDRQRYKEAAGTANAEYRAAHDRVVAALTSRDELSSDPIRIGRFRLVKTMSAGHAVSFETEPRERIVIEARGDS